MNSSGRNGFGEIRRRFPATRRLFRRPPLALSLSAALLPLAGVLWFGAPVGSMIGLYWLENVLVGAFWLPRLLGSQTLLADEATDRALVNSPDLSEAQRTALSHNTARVQHALIPGFFCVHYGLFCLVHAVFVFNLFEGAWSGLFTTLGGIVIVLMVIEQGFKLRDFRADPELAALPRGLLMLAPYPRVITLQFTLLLAGLPAIAGYPAVAAVLLAAIRFYVDHFAAFSDERADHDH